MSPYALSAQIATEITRAGVKAGAYLLMFRLPLVET
jgi:hypothetical protein